MVIIAEAVAGRKDRLEVCAACVIVILPRADAI
jgi:hypothetical protein